jgi:hypothetical protein
MFQEAALTPSFIWENDHIMFKGGIAYFDAESVWGTGGREFKSPRSDQ